MVDQNGPPNDETLDIKTTFPDKPKVQQWRFKIERQHDGTLNIKIAFPDNTNRTNMVYQKRAPLDETLNIKTTFPDKPKVHKGVSS